MANTVQDFTSVTLFTPTADASLQIGTGIDGYVDDFRVTIGKAFHPYPGSFLVANDSFGSSTVDSEWDYVVPTAGERASVGPVSGMYDWRDAGPVAQYTDANPGGGGANDSGLDPILDVIDSTSRRLTGLDFSPDGTKVVACSYSGIIATFSLSTAWDISTASQTGTSITGVTLANNVRFVDNGNKIVYIRATDTMATRDLATQWQVANTDAENSAVMSKSEWGKGAQSYDGPWSVTNDGLYAYGLVRDATTPNHYFFLIAPLNTAFDFDDRGTITEYSFGTTSVAASTTSGTVHLSESGERATIFGVDGSAEAIHSIVMSTPFDAGTGTLVPPNPMPNVATNYDMCAFSPDLRRIFAWNAIFVTNFDEYGYYAIPSV